VSKPGEVIAARIQELIVSDVLRPGDRVPPERALAERFGVGRGHVREALKRLEPESSRRSTGLLESGRIQAR
jgi:GntR family transcriptional repressor for pyruvate dehydrogenase complex